MDVTQLYCNTTKIQVEPVRSRSNYEIHRKVSNYIV